MTQKEPFWTLEDYQRFLTHSDYSARYWAVKRIEHQFPHLAAKSLVHLLNDQHILLQNRAAQAIADAKEPSYEEAVLAVLPESKAVLRNHLLTALGQMRSATMLPHFLAVLESDSEGPTPIAEIQLDNAIDGLAQYPDEAARKALWRFAKYQRYVDHKTCSAFSGILRFADAETIPRLLKYSRRLKQEKGFSWTSIMSPFAEAVGLERIYEEALTSCQQGGPSKAWDTIQKWFKTRLPLSRELEFEISSIAYKTPIIAHQKLLRGISRQIERFASKRQDDYEAWLVEWAAGKRLSGYGWRMILAYQTISTLLTLSKPTAKQAEEELTLALVLLAQVSIDENDEVLLAATTNKTTRGRQLLKILASSRPNVLPSIEKEIAAFGPVMIPHLIKILSRTEESFWAIPRTLRILTQLASQHPGSLDSVVPAILYLINEEQHDYILEQANKCLIAIGPAAVEGAIDGLDAIDLTYDIYVSKALGEIPTPESLEALLAYVSKRGLDEQNVSSIEALGQVKAIPLLKNVYRPGNEVIAQSLYTISVLNDYEEPQLEQWQTDTEASNERFERNLLGGSSLAKMLTNSLQSPVANSAPKKSSRRSRPSNKKHTKHESRGKRESKEQSKAESKEEPKKRRRRRRRRRRPRNQE